MNFDPYKARTRNSYSQEEKDFLLQIVHNNKELQDLIYRKDPKINMAKNKAWHEIAIKLNERFGRNITGTQTRRLYNNLKNKFGVESGVDAEIYAPDLDMKIFDEQEVEDNDTYEGGADTSWPNMDDDLETDGVDFESFEAAPAQSSSTRKRDPYSPPKKRLLLEVMKKVESLYDPDDLMQNSCRAEIWKQVTQTFNRIAGSSYRKEDLRRLYQNSASGGQQHKRASCDLSESSDAYSKRSRTHSDQASHHRHGKGKHGSHNADTIQANYRGSIRESSRGESMVQLCWSDQEHSIGLTLLEMWREKDNMDVRIICDHFHEVEAHSVVLSACSTFFRQVLSHSRELRPVIYLRGIQDHELDGILEYMYTGGVDLQQQHLPQFLQVAADLGVKGLTTDLLSKSGPKRGDQSKDSSKDSSTMPKATEKRAPERATKKESEAKARSEKSIDPLLSSSTVGTTSSHHVGHDVDFSSFKDLDMFDNSDTVMANANKNGGSSNNIGCGAEEAFAGAVDNDGGSCDQSSAADLLQQVDGSELLTATPTPRVDAFPDDDNDPRLAAGEHAKWPHDLVNTQSGRAKGDSMGGAYICQVCGKTFGSSNIALLVHQKTEHPALFK